MADHTRPLLIGYFREIFFATAPEKAAIRRRFTDFAAREGFAMDSILCEDFDQARSELDRLIGLAELHGVSAVVISTPDDLDQDQRRRLEREAGVHILLAPSP
ncbi:hypothetical protein E1218_06930 [Kribbella turkmenica]|uniref:Resolvase/invertase-type recombinase catalytic domain-containing protein n=1 Tax=Kribbella turkmenica TaxID=2530375 RepID=A0A4V2YGV4_9ACTN|nr:hypothetical protein [Kribbella turkmenica]TDD28547.1 hypothetical protein E1218_06930 [Kribbella turkmenica]